MSAQEFFPAGSTAPLRRRFDPVLLQNVRNRSAADRVAQMGQRAKYPPIAPIPILRFQAHHRGLEMTVRSCAPRIPLLTPLELISAYPLMPSINCYVHD